MIAPSSYVFPPAFIFKTSFLIKEFPCPQWDLEYLEGQARVQQESHTDHEISHDSTSALLSEGVKPECLK